MTKVKRKKELLKIGESFEKRIKISQERVENAEEAYRRFSLAMKKLTDNQRKIINDAIHTIEQEQIKKLRKQVS